MSWQNEARNSLAMYSGRPRTCEGRELLARACQGCYDLAGLECAGHRLEGRQLNYGRTCTVCRRDSLRAVLLNLKLAANVGVPGC